jgi:hypothetical protein
MTGEEEITGTIQAKKKLGLSMMRLQREQGTGTAIAANL